MRPESPRFSLQTVTYLTRSYPGRREDKQKVIKEESIKFREKIIRDRERVMA